jgi:hypothetical protein
VHFEGVLVIKAFGRILSFSSVGTVSS